jgi:hypothetical protein
MIHSVITELNKSKIFAGVVLIMLNIASKYITIKLTPSQETFLRNYISRELFVFATCWLGTRDIYVAVGITLLFDMIMYIFNEDSPMGLLPKQEGMDTPVQPDEIKSAIQVLRRAKEQEEKNAQTELFNYYNFNQM